MITDPLSPVLTRRALFAAVTLASALALSVVVLIAPGAGATSGASLSTVRLAAGHRVVDNTGQVWRSDRSYATGGTIARTSHHINGTATQGLFRSARVGRFGYRISVAPGWYRVTLGMAEQVFRKPGQRVFTFEANGAVRIASLDASRKGRWRVSHVTTTVKVAHGKLDLDLLPQRHAAAISTILVVGYRKLTNPTRSTPPAAGPSTPAAPTSSPTSQPAPNGPATSVPTVTVPTATVPTATVPVTTVPTSSSPTTPVASSSASTPNNVVTPQQFGARGDGVTDDTAALQKTFDEAAGRVVLLPAGQIYAHANLLHLRTAGLHISGPGQLLATNEQESSVWIEADNVVLDGGLVVRTASTTQRWGTWDQMGIRLNGHAGAVLRNVVVDGSAAAGIYVGGAHDFVLDHVTVRNTRADGIHMTGGSYHGTVTSPTVVDSGDDGVAIVSYKQDGPPCHDITVASPRVLGTTWGRGLSVVGGTNITETDIDVERTSAAAVYLGAEGNPWYTTAAANVVVSGGKIVGANTDTSVDHGAVLVLSGESDVAPANIVVRSLTISGTRSSASRDLGVVTYGATPSGILFSDITISGGPTSAYQGNTAQSAYTLHNIVQNGVRLPDAG